MCGICGILNIDRQPVDLVLLKDMMNLMHHRGPDDEGTYNNKYMGMGVRRLKVIDLETGHQPICNEDETVWVVQNGEIYNYRELRNGTKLKGHIYKSRSDTEVIVHLYEEYGDDFVKKLNGMFSIALWDEIKDKLILVRDRIGIKPLFYFIDAKKLIFASEIKAILKDRSIKHEINMEAFNYYLSYKFVPAPLSMFNNIHKLLPGHMLILERGKIKINQYWNFEYDEMSESRNNYLERFHEVLKESIQRHLISDVPLGIFLSGGIDSSVLLDIVSELVDIPIKTFSIAFEDEYLDERRYARVVADQYRTDHHELIVKPDTIDVLSKLIWYLDEPLGDSCVLPTYYLSKFAREYVTVALSGDGGDELFAGYDRYRREKFISFFCKIPRWIQKGILGSAANFSQLEWKAKLIDKSLTLPLGKRYKFWMENISEEDQYKLINHSISNIDSSDIVQKYFEECDGAENLKKMLYVDLKTYLPDDLLFKVDRMSMANSLEVRVPFLDKKVIEFSASLPTKLKLKGFGTTKTKYLLRKYLQGRLPADIHKKKKQGFNLPVDSWFRGELKSFAYDVLLDSGVNSSGIFNTKGLELFLNQHQDGENHGEAIWALIAFELWRKEYIDA